MNGFNTAGILNAKWDHFYFSGSKPCDWRGSVEIFEKFLENDGRSRRPVNYGQCWTFACVTTTACRTLGIPCRPITCFESAAHQDVSVG